MKPQRGKLSPEQFMWSADFMHAGGLYREARSLDEVERYLRDEWEIPLRAHIAGFGVRKTAA